MKKSKFNLTEKEVDELLTSRPSMFNAGMLLDLKRMYDLFHYVLNTLEKEHGIKLEVDGINN